VRKVEEESLVTGKRRLVHHVRGPPVEVRGRAHKGAEAAPAERRHAHEEDAQRRALEPARNLKVELIKRRLPRRARAARDVGRVHKFAVERRAPRLEGRDQVGRRGARVLVVQVALLATELRLAANMPTVIEPDE